MTVAHLLLRSVGPQERVEVDPLYDVVVIEPLPLLETLPALQPPILLPAQLHLLLPHVVLPALIIPHVVLPARVISDIVLPALIIPHIVLLLSLLPLQLLHRNTWREENICL